MPPFLRWHGLTGSVFNNICRELSPNKRYRTGLPFLIPQHLQVTSLTLPKVDGIVEVLLMVAVI